MNWLPAVIAPVFSPTRTPPALPDPVKAQKIRGLRIETDIGGTKWVYTLQRIATVRSGETVGYFELVLYQPNRTVHRYSEMWTVRGNRPVRLRTFPMSVKKR